MIDLDDSITRALTLAGWREQEALQTVDGLVALSPLSTDYEPPDEEWIRFWNEVDMFGMLSVRVPLALASSRATEALARVNPRVIAVTVPDFGEENLRASPDLLRRSVLPDGWDDEFNTEAFCASDLFVVSV